MGINITANITGIKYTPVLCRELNTFTIDKLENAISQKASFILRVDEENQIALSWWVSPKRTRSYPYARVYDTLGFIGKKVTLIPIIKDEGKDGDRDFLQWDTISLMSLLEIFVIISYYSDAKRNENCENKITEQKFDFSHVKSELSSLLSFHSDALHWNLTQIEKVGELAEKALKAYKNISKKLGVRMHSEKSAKKRIQELIKGKENFMCLSRTLAEKAQKRESMTVQPKEKLEGIKGMLTIKNYLGGYYFFTVDEVRFEGSNIYLIEGKHTKTKTLPSLEDIKDGLLKMILYTNLRDVKVNGKSFNPIPVLKLTTTSRFEENLLENNQKEMLNLLKKEAKTNNFKLMINDSIIN